MEEAAHLGSEPQALSRCEGQAAALHAILFLKPLSEGRETARSRPVRARESRETYVSVAYLCVLHISNIMRD
jgi:hypothetical protein